MNLHQILTRLRDLGGCAGGLVIYHAAKAAAALLNVFHGHEGLHPHTQTLLQPYFPQLDLGHVRVVPKAILPGRWYRRDVTAMTFGYRIYCRGEDVQRTATGRKLLLHELVHVDQVRRRGDSEYRFACDYGKGFLRAGSYRANPLEIEAYDFVDASPLP